MQMQFIITIVKISSLIVAAQKNFAREGTVSQSSTLYIYYAYWAIRGPTTNEWNGGCSSTGAYQLTAWWRLELPELVYVTHVKIYYRSGLAHRMKGFSLYMSNGTVDAADKLLCYKDLTIQGNPKITQDIDCYTLTKNVYFFNNRSIVVQPGEGAFVELCYIAIYGCVKGTWGIDCLKPCPANCIANHCYPGNGSCIWGCDCLHGTCNMITSVCTEGCKAGLIGQYCNNTNYNLASNGIATQTPSNTNHPAYLSVDGNRTGSCSMTSESNSYLQVDTGSISIITMIYITFDESKPFNNSNYSIYCSNTSDSWNNDIKIYNGKRPTEDIYVAAVCRYVVYVPPIIRDTSRVDLCEIEIGGCHVGKYGVNCKLNCLANCISKSCDLDNGYCTFGCTDGWIGEMCNETSQAFEDTGLITAIIGSISGATFVVILAVSLCVVYRRLFISKEQRNHPNIENRSVDTINSSPRTCNEQPYEDLMRMEPTSTYQELTIHSVSNDYNQINQDYVNN